MISLKKELNKTFSSEALSILKAIGEYSQKSGINAYLIGGCVRDIIIGNDVFDIDIVVEADAIEFSQMLAQTLDAEVISVQSNLKTAKVLFQNGIEVDFSSTRKEKYEQSGKLPELCEFGCALKDDVLRRDFSINTLAIRLNDNEEYALTDYLNGFEDIKNKQLKILHDKSFIDDPSRIIRGIKFALRFKFNFDEHTLYLLNDYLDCHINIDMPFERIKGELKQLFSLPYKETAYAKMISMQAYKIFSNNALETFSQERYEIILQKGLISEQQAAFLPFAFLCVNSSLPFEKLNLTTTEMNILKDFQELLRINDIDINDNVQIYETYHSKSELAIVCKYIYSGEKTALKFLETLKEIKVLINGNDLIALGFVPSELFSQIFDAILKKKLNNELKTKEEELEFVRLFFTN